MAALIREEIARRRMSRQQLADKAKLSLSTLEKVLGGRRPLTLATAVRVEEALGVSLRRSAPDAEAPPKDGVAPDGLGVYLVTNRHGQHRLITVSRPMITGA